ncbi:MAG: hypothetical protein FWE14_02665 [Lachnospiraceae bacterium]|nr:hypothetical protein [Lachnospiraceae bacterium]
MSRLTGQMIGRSMTSGLGTSLFCIIFGVLLIIAGLGVGTSRLAAVVSGAAVYVNDLDMWDRATGVTVIEINNNETVVEYDYTTANGTKERGRGVLYGKPDIQERVGLSTYTYYEKANPTNIARETFDFMGGIMGFIFPILFGSGPLYAGLWLRKTGKSGKETK